MDELAVSLKTAYPRALATLIRLLRDIDAAEGTLQEAIARALEVWSREGVPGNPVAWLVTTGRNKAIDLQWRYRLEVWHSATVRAESGNSVTGETVAGSRVAAAEVIPHFDDDLLRLIFTCCHPALAQEVQVALTLKTSAGLTVPEIACAFLVPPKTNEQRITRAKRKILAARIPYEVRAAAQLTERLDAVLAVKYLLFNEGYNRSGGPDLIRTDLCIEAIRLARMLSRLFRAEPEVTGLLALLLLQHSRSGARLDTAGQIIPWDEQKRVLWYHSLIVEGSALVEKALRQQQPGPYQVQAAVAAVYCEASQAADTDWTQIAELYDILERYQPSPVVRLNRAVAVAKVQGAAAGIAPLRTVEDSREIQRYHHFYAALGALLAEDNQAERALAAYETALLLTQNPSEQTALQKKITCLASSVSQNP